MIYNQKSGCALFYAHNSNFDPKYADLNNERPVRGNL